VEPSAKLWIEFERVLSDEALEHGIVTVLWPSAICTVWIDRLATPPEYGALAR
jgi:hypothetical protein